MSYFQTNSLEEWEIVCPGCEGEGGDNGPEELLIDYPRPGWKDNGMYSTEDTLTCGGCGWTGSFQDILTIAKKKPCPCCSGTGLVSSETDTKESEK